MVSAYLFCAIFLIFVSNPDVLFFTSLQYNFFYCCIFSVC